MNRHHFASLMALGAALAAGAASHAQDTPEVPPPAAVGVAGSSFQLGLFGGGGDDGGLYGGAPSLMVPLGDNVGLQVDGIAGVAADEIGFFGGGVQLFYRQPQSHLLGLAGAAFVEDGETQYTLAAIAEYYADRITLEATAGYQGGDIIDGSAFARLGGAYYATPNLRIGGGLTYTEEQNLGADVEVEALVAPSSGLALFASGAFDDSGSLGLVGARLYLNGLAPTEAAEGPSLIAVHRELGRRNLFEAAPIAIGTRLISKAGGAMAKGEAFGDLAAEPAPPPAATALGDAPSPLAGLLDGILPAGSTGTPLDDIPVVGDLVGRLATLASPETLRTGDLPTGPNSVANLPLVGDLIGALPAGGVTALLGSAKPDQILQGLAPALLQGLLQPETLSSLGGGLLEGSLGNILSGLAGGVPSSGGLPLSGSGLPLEGVLALVTNAKPDQILSGLVPALAGGVLSPVGMPGL